MKTLAISDCYVRSFKYIIISHFFQDNADFSGLAQSPRTRHPEPVISVVKFFVKGIKILWEDLKVWVVPGKLLERKRSETERSLP
jgi:hypothetical protein